MSGRFAKERQAILEAENAEAALRMAGRGVPRSVAAQAAISEASARVQVAYGALHAARRAWLASEGLPLAV